MRLSPDCVRDILLVVEECEFNRPYTLDRLAEKLPAYSRDMLWYTCLKLGEANFLNLETTHEMGSFHLSVYRILDLTYQKKRIWKNGQRNFYPQYNKCV